MGHCDHKIPTKQERNQSTSQRALCTHTLASIIYPDGEWYANDDSKTRKKGVAPPIIKHCEHLLSKKREREAEQ